jgi:hypothetical protein
VGTPARPATDRQAPTWIHRRDESRRAPTWVHRRDRRRIGTHPRGDFGATRAGAHHGHIGTTTAAVNGARPRGYIGTTDDGSARTHVGTSARRPLGTHHVGTSARRPRRLMERAPRGYAGATGDGSASTHVDTSARPATDRHAPTWGLRRDEGRRAPRAHRHDDRGGQWSAPHVGTSARPATARHAPRGYIGTTTAAVNGARPT